MQERVMPSQEEIDSRKDIWRNKKCPSCCEIIKEYYMAALIYPYQDACKEALISHWKTKNAFPFPVTSLAGISYYELCRLTLSASCKKCNFISLWNFDFADGFAISQLCNEGYVIVDPHNLKHFIETLEKEQYDSRKNFLSLYAEWLKK